MKRNSSNNYLGSHIDWGGEASRVLGGSDDELVDVRLTHVLEVELLGELDDAGGGADVEGAGALALRLQGIADLAVGKRLRLHGDDAAKQVNNYQ